MAIQAKDFSVKPHKTVKGRSFRLFSQSAGWTLRAANAVWSSMFYTEISRQLEPGKREPVQKSNWNHHI